MPIELQGFDELQSSLEKMGEDLEFGAGVDRALRAGAEPIYRQMKSNASSNPKIITGALNKSIKKSGVRKRKGRKQITIGVHHKEYSAYYSNPVEYGHGGPAPAPPHPFVRPAFDTQQDAAYSAIRSVLQNEIKSK